jgi:Tfp pilus assembly protein PilO
MLALTVGYALFFYLPGKRAMEQLTVELQSKRAAIARGEQTALQLQDANQELRLAREYIATWRQRTASGAGSASIFGQLSAVAKDAGATTTRFEPSATVDMDCLRKLPLTLGCTGSFEQVFALLHGLEGLPRYVWVDELRLERKREGDKDLQCELKLAIFADKTKNSN